MGDRIDIAFVGAVVPDEVAYHTEAFNRSGDNFQRNLIAELARQPDMSVEVISILPVPSYPRGGSIWIGFRRFRLGLCRALLLPFVNITPIKQITIGLGVIAALVAWRLRSRQKRRVLLSYKLSVPPGLFTLLVS